MIVPVHEKIRHGVGAALGAPLRPHDISAALHIVLRPQIVRKRHRL